MQYAEVQQEYKPTVHGMIPPTPTDAGSAPMEIGLVGKGGKGHDKGGKWGSKSGNWHEKGKPNKGKGQDKSGKGKPPKGKGTSKGNPKGSPKGDGGKGGGAGSSAPNGQQNQNPRTPYFEGTCSYCGKYGHKRVDCWSRGRVGMVGEWEAAAPVAPTGSTADHSEPSGETVGILVEPPMFVMMVSGSGLHGSDSALVYVDSGSDANVVPKGWAPLGPFRHKGKSTVAGPLFDISGKSLGDACQTWHVWVELGGLKFPLRITEANVTMAVLSAGSLSDVQGLESHLVSESPHLLHQATGKRIPLERRNRRFTVPLRVVGLVRIAGGLSDGLDEVVVDPTSASTRLADDNERKVTTETGVGERDSAAQAADQREEKQKPVAMMDLEVPPAVEMDVVGPEHTVQQIRTRLSELSAPTWGTKLDLLRRVREYEALRRQEHAVQTEIAQRHDARLRDGTREMLGPRILPCPREPTEAERKTHMLTHLPTAPWCELCVAAKSRALPHSLAHPVTERPRAPPVIQVDYMFMAGRNVEQKLTGGVDEEHPVTVLTALDEQTGIALAAGLRSKEVDGYQVELLLEYIERLAHTEVTLHSDSEQSMRSLLEKVCAKRSTDRTFTRFAPKFSSQSIGRLAAIQNLIQGQVRALKLDIEQRLGEQVPVRSPLFFWAVRHAAWLLNRFRVMLDSTSPYFHAYGIAYKGALVRFAEVLMFQHPQSQTGMLTKHIRRAKAEALWERGVFLGKTEKSDEFLVGTAGGLFKVRSVRRLVESRQWDGVMAKGLISFPWAPNWGVPGIGRIAGRHVEAGTAEEPEEMDEAGEMADARLSAEAPWAYVVTRGDMRARGRSPSVARSGPIGRLEGPGVTGVGSDTRPTKRARETATAGGTASTGNELVGGGGVPVPASTAEGAGEPTTTAPLAVAMDAEDGRLHGETRAREMVEPTGAEEVPDSKRYRTVGALSTMDVDNSGDLETIGDWKQEDEEAEEEAEEGDDPEKGPQDPEERQQVKAAGMAKELSRLQDTFKAFEAVQRPPRTRDFKKNQTVEFFAPSSTTSTSRLLDAIAVKRGCLHFEIDAECAFLHTPVGDERDPIYIEAAPEWIEEHSEELAKVGVSDPVWKMLKMINGLRDAPQAWINFAAKVLTEELSFSRCLVAPCFYAREVHTSRMCMLELHMDDIHGICQEAAVYAEIVEQLRQHIRIKALGPIGPGGIFTHLRRTREIHEDRILLKPCARYANDVLTELGLLSCTPVTTPRAELSPKVLAELRAKGPLSDEEQKRFRTLTGKLLYLSLDRHDLCYPVKELTRHLKSPDHESWAHLKRVGRYLAGTRDAHIVLSKGSGVISRLTAYSDADFAGDPETRRSTSGYVLDLDGCVLCAGARTQNIVSLSTAESEFYALTTAASELCHISSVLSFFGLEHTRVVVTDSSAALGIAQRSGQGRVKHLSTRAMWIQSFVQKGVFTIAKVDGKINVADIGTKTLPAARLNELCRLMGLVTNDSTTSQGQVSAAVYDGSHQTRTPAVSEVLGLLVALLGGARGETDLVCATAPMKSQKFDFIGVFVGAWCLGVLCGILFCLCVWLVIRRSTKETPHPDAVFPLREGTERARLQPKLLQSTFWYAPLSGKCVHSSNQCRGLINASVVNALGLRACKLCMGTAPELERLGPDAE
eukprot:6492776-Amphidinium_carterae.1